MKTDETPSNMRNFQRKQLKSKLNEVSKILNYISTENITPTNMLKAAGCVVARKVGFKTKVAKPQEPRWKKRI